uniref:Uncharacterized protein n=1 Tax=Alexandrium monilatum TaxID=311494 RepID=A0A7S4PT07_9DINO
MVASPKVGEMQPLMSPQDSSSSGPEAGHATLGTQVRSSLNNNASKTEKPTETDRAELQRALETMPQTPVSEASLHEVSWQKLGWEFGVNVVVSVLFLTMSYYIVWKLPKFPFKVFIIPVLCMIVFGLLVVLVEVVRSYFKDTSASVPSAYRLVAASPLLQAILGKEIITLQSTSDVYIFAHSIERHSREPGAFLENVVNPVDPKLPRLVYSVSGKEIPPGRYKATALLNDEKDYTEKLMEAANGDLYPTLSQVVEDFIFREDPPIKTPCMVELTASSKLGYFSLLYSHWFVRLIVNSLMITFCAMPVAVYINHMHAYKVLYCNQGRTEVLPFCGANKDGKTCKDSCGDLLSFLGEVGFRIGVEEIELIWTISLGIVTIFVLSIYFVGAGHRILETKFILSIGGISKEEENEVMQVRKCLDENNSIVSVVHGLFKQYGSYQSQLHACEPLMQNIYSGSRLSNKTPNACFWEVTREWRNMRIGQAVCIPFDLPICAGEHYEDDVHGEKQDLCTWKEMVQSCMKELATFKNAAGVSRRDLGTRQKGFKFCVSVPVTCRESLELLKAEFFTKSGSAGYTSQLDAIFETADCQDKPPANGGFCHVREDFRVGPLLIPAGVCLTHVACVAPDGTLLSLQVGKGKDIPDKHAFLDLFKGTQNDKLNKSLVLEQFSQYHWPSIMLPSAKSHASLLEKSRSSEPAPLDSQALTAKVRDAYICSISFVFQISPSYFQALKQTMRESDVSLYGFTEQMFKRLQEGQVSEPALAPNMLDHLETIKKQSWKDASSSSCCLVLGPDKTATRSRLFSLCVECLGFIGLFLLCLVFVLIVPLFRYFRWGSELFPKPFTWSLVTNALVQLFFLFGYFQLFTGVSSRMTMINQALEVLSQKTLSPPKNATPHNSATSRSTTFQEPGSQSSPFELYIDSTKDYDPTDTSWVPKWQAKEKAVMNWHLCTRYLRVFSSRSRLTGQAILICAAAILGIMLLVDVEQGLHGSGIVGVNQQAVIQDLQDSTVQRLEDIIQSGFNDAGQAVQGMAEGTAHAAAKNLGRRLRLLASGREEPFDFAGASEALQQALRPVDAAVERLRMRQLQDVAPHLVDVGAHLQTVQHYASVGNVQHISQANLLTVVMTVLLLIYSINLLARIAGVNDHIDKHESILVRVKETHLHKQSERELLWASKTGDATQSAEEASDSQNAVNQAQASYERMLDMCIQSANDSRGRFPMKIFGFVITQALLVAWLAAGLQPLLNQATQVIPPLAASACQWFDSSDVGSTVEHSLETASSEFAKHVLNTNETASTGEHNIVYSLVCVPLLSTVDTTLGDIAADDDAARDVTANEDAYGLHHQDSGDADEAADAAADAADAGRRLSKARDLDMKVLSPQSMRQLVEDWWNAHPGDGESKLALVRTVLEERGRFARRLLMAGPQALQAAIKSGRLRAGPALLGKRRSRRSRQTPRRQTPALGTAPGEL